MKQTKHTLFLFTLLFSSIGLFAQGSMRIEFEADPNELSFGAIPVHDSLLIFGALTDGKTKAGETWFFSLYDKYLKKVRSKNYSFSEDLQYVDYADNGKSIFILLYHKKPKDEKQQSILIRYEKQTAQLAYASFPLPGQCIVKDFDAINDVILVALETKKEKVELYTLNFNNKSLTPLEDRVVNDGYVSSVTVDGNTFVVVLKSEPSNNENLLLINYYDQTGSLVRSVELDHPTSGMLFNNGQYFKLQDGKAIVLGSFYRNRKGRNQKVYDHVRELSTGIYFSILEGDQIKKLRFHSFSDFPNMYGYITESNYSALSNAVKRKEKGKEVLTHFSMLIHEVQQYQDDYIMVSETYHPEYRQERRYNYDYYNRAYPQYYQVFEGYRFNNAFVLAFDKEGNIKWNNGMNMEDILSPDLGMRSSVVIDSTGVFLSYPFETNLISKFFNDGTIQQQLYTMPLELGYRTDMLMSEYNVRMKQWYDNYYFIEGYQSIRNTNLRKNKRRNVFFVSKLILE